MIRVVRVHQAAGVYVGRPTELGNPSIIGTHGSREQVMEKYRVWLRKQWRFRRPARAFLEQLVDQYRATGQLTLQCHCAPQRCHAEVIADAIINIATRAGHRA
jgi:Domain of unknown function (DUF4326)